MPIQTAPDEASYRAGLVGLILIGAVLRLVGLNWDEGRGLHPDESNLVRAALSLSVPDQMIPSFHAYNDLALWLPRLVAWPLCAAGEEACLTLVARALSALVAVATIPVAAALGRLLAGRWAGLGAAAAFAGSAPLVQWAHFGTTESVLVFLTVALWYLAAAWLAGRGNPQRHVLGSAVLLGIGIGFKTTMLVLAVIPATAVILQGWPDRARLRTITLGALLVPLLGLATSPSILFATADWLNVMKFEADVVAGRLQVFWTAQFDTRPAGWFDARQLFSAMAGSGLVLAVAGLWVLPISARRLALPGLALLLVYGAIYLGWHARFFRYLAPILPILLILAGVGVGRAVSACLPDVPTGSAPVLRMDASSGPKSQAERKIQTKADADNASRGRAEPRPPHRTLAALALAGLGWMILAGIDQASIYLRTDPRIAGHAALIVRAAPDDLVAIEPRDMAQTDGLAHILLPVHTPEVSHQALAAPLAEAQWLVIASRRNWAVLPARADAPASLCALYAGLGDGALGYVLAYRAHRPGLWGRFFVPGIAIEETRSVFDRPEVLVFRNEAGLAAGELEDRLADARSPQDCAPSVLARTLGLGP